MDRAAEMTAFVRSVDGGGFSAAARELGLTPSALSKLVTRLEDRLGARLLQRTTRRLQLTPEGEAFYVRSRRILADMDEAEAEAGRISWVAPVARALLGARVGDMRRLRTPAGMEEIEVVGIRYSGA
jgi:DNA-binding transcriptional LysR family regulator